MWFRWRGDRGRWSRGRRRGGVRGFDKGTEGGGGKGDAAQRLVVECEKFGGVQTGGGRRGGGLTVDGEALWALRLMVMFGRLEERCSLV